MPIAKEHQTTAMKHLKILQPIIRNHMRPASEGQPAVENNGGLLDSHDAVQQPTANRQRAANRQQ